VQTPRQELAQAASREAVAQSAAPRLEVAEPQPDAARVARREGARRGRAERETQSQAPREVASAAPAPVAPPVALRDAPAVVADQVPAPVAAVAPTPAAVVHASPGPAPAPLVAVAGTVEPAQAAAGQQAALTPPPPRFEDIDPLTERDSTVQAADSAGAMPEVMTGSMRRAEDQARSTAVRLYGEGVPIPVAEAASRNTGVAAAAAAAAASRPALPPIAASTADAVRSVEEAEAMAAAALSPPPPAYAGRAPASAAVSLPPEPPVSAGAPRGRTPTSPGLAQGLESVASLGGGKAPKAVRASGRPPIGRQIHVGRGDTVWAIAMQYYGTVDQSVLAQIFRYNGRISDAHRLDQGTEVFLPFLSPEQMVGPASGGGYQVLLAESTDSRLVDRAAAWASSALPGRALRTASRGKGTPVRMIYAVGFPSRDAALESARYLLGRS